jgi:hypothetical protein
MRRPILVSIAMLSAYFLLAGCSGSDSQAGKHHYTHEESHGAKLAMHSEGDSGASGTAAFEDVSKGVLVKLELRGLPKLNTLYLAHIHPGTCSKEEEEEGAAHEHGEHAEEGEGHEHGEEIEYPLSEVKSDSKGNGSSTTTVQKTSVEKLFTGKDKHVNVHEAGAGNPPVLSCADLKQAG